MREYVIRAAKASASPINLGRDVVRATLLLRTEEEIRLEQYQRQHQEVVDRVQHLSVNEHELPVESYLRRKFSTAELG